MKKEPEISIIIRSKNEEKWIGRCIKQINKQIINKTWQIIVVDSGSKDKTIEVARNCGAKIIKIKDYKPGYAINKGVEQTKSKVIVLLSAHCLPANNNWLNKLTEELFDDESNINAVYGRQLPTPSSNPNDVRDLAITFGIEDKVQNKDTFFHNANSAFTREIWEKEKFNNTITNIEDRLWAEKIISEGNPIKYKSNACVFHWHGIHQYGNNERAEYTANILRRQANLDDNEYEYPKEGGNVTAIVTFSSEDGNEEHQRALLYKLLTCLGNTSVEWNIIINSRHPLIKSEEKIPRNTKYTWIEKLDSDNMLHYPHILKKNIETFEELTESITEYCAAFNLSYLWRESADIDNIIRNFCEYDYDIMTPILMDEYSKDATISENINRSMYADTAHTTAESIIANTKRRSENNLGICIPGYCLMFRSSILRRPKEKENYRIGKFYIRGQEKLLKIETSHDYLELMDKIRLNSFG